MLSDSHALDLRMKFFRSRCAERGLAMTHQRWVIYRFLAATTRHPTPEETFARVRKEIPSLSLATVYKNIRTFLDAGLLREVTTPGQTMRLDANMEFHHHLICSRCGTIFDLPGDWVVPASLQQPLPKGFRVESCTVNFWGFCGHCSPQDQASN